jgi:phosphatidylserine decarboxylase
MSIAKEAWPFAGPLAGLSVLAVALGHPFIGAAFLPALGFVLWFFRDPERVSPTNPAGLLSPADGRIIRAGPSSISVFMNLADVHVCRTPVSGRVLSVEHVPGRFLAAFKDSASEQNERVSIVVDSDVGSVRFVLVAGLLARRIVCKVVPGQWLGAGERIGLIRFGSRVDLFLPPRTRPLVALGDRVVAGCSVLAQWEATSDAGTAPVVAAAVREFPI